jgi:hypothetical protein
LANATFTVTGFRCENCGHWNNLKRRKQKQPNTKLTDAGTVSVKLDET